MKYAVVCCSGQPLAYVVDDRPNGPLTIEPASEEDKLTIIAADIADRHIDIRRDIDSAPPQMGSKVIPYEFAATRWGGASLTETRWPDWHITWTINCRQCRKRAEISDTTMVRVADLLPRENWFVHPDNGICVVPLGRVNLMLTHMNG